MNIVIEKNNIVEWVKSLNDEAVIQKILALKSKNENNSIENKLIEKGLKDISEGKIYSHDEVVNRFEERFSKK